MSKQEWSRLLLVGGSFAVVLGAVARGSHFPQRSLADGALSAGLVVLAVWAVLNRRSIAAFLGKRSSRRGADTFVAVSAFLAILVVVQALSSRYSARYDLTKDKRFRLAEQTVSVLDSLSKDVRITAFFKRATPEEALARDLLDAFRHRTRRIVFELLDPDQRPQRARDLDVRAFGTTVVEAGTRRETIARLTEESLLNAIVKVTKEATRPVCFVRGHGEREPSNTDRNGYSIATVALEREGFEVRTLSLFDAPSVPEDCAVVVVAGPRRDYLESEIAKIQEHLDRGKGALFLLEPHTDLPNLEILLSRFGIRLNKDAVVDPVSRVFGGDYSIPVVTEYPAHPITRGFELATFYPTARSLVVAEGTTEELKTQTIAKTGKSAWGETDLRLIDKGKAVRNEEDNLGPLSLAAVAEKKTLSPPGVERREDRKSAIVVFGDADFAANSSFRMSGNSDMFLNAMDYLAREEHMIAIRPKTSSGDRLFLTAAQGRFIFLVAVVLMPLAVLSCGVAVWTGRRRRG